MAAVYVVFLIFVACATYGVCDATTIYTRPKVNTTKEDVGEKDIINADNGASGISEGRSAQNEVQVQDTSNIACPPGFDKVEIYCYKINLQEGEHRQHQDLCFQSGGYLVEVGTGEENTALVKYMRSLNLDLNHQRYLHIGLFEMHWGTKHGAYYSWMYSTEGVPYNNWAAGRPIGRPCGFVLLSSNQFGKWFDEFCNRLNGAICEANRIIKP